MIRVYNDAGQTIFEGNSSEYLKFDKNLKKENKNNKRTMKFFGLIVLFIIIGIVGINIIANFSNIQEERIILNKKIIVEKFSINNNGEYIIIRDTISYNENDSLFLLNKSGKKLYKVDTKNIRYIDFLTK